MRKITIAAAIASSILALGAIAVAQDAVMRAPLQKSDFPGDQHGPDLMAGTIAHGGGVAPHTPPGSEMGYVQDGEAVLSVAGQPDRQLKPGDSYLIPAGTVHSAKNTGKTAVKVVAAFVVEKAKPLASPAK